MHTCYPPSGYAVTTRLLLATAVLYGSAVKKKPRGKPSDKVRAHVVFDRTFHRDVTAALRRAGNQKLGPYMRLALVEKMIRDGLLPPG